MPSSLQSRVDCAGQLYQKLHVELKLSLSSEATTLREDTGRPALRLPMFRSVDEPKPSTEQDPPYASCLSSLCFNDSLSCRDAHSHPRASVLHTAAFWRDTSHSHLLATSSLSSYAPRTGGTVGHLFASLPPARRVSAERNKDSTRGAASTRLEYRCPVV